MIAAAVFDFDGVIVDSVDIKGRAFESLYAEHGPAIATQVRAYHDAHGGLSRYRKLDYFERELLGRQPTQRDIDEIADAFARAVVDEVVAADEFEGAIDLIAWLKHRIPVYVSSGTPHDELNDIIMSRGYTNLFDGWYGSPATKADNLRRIARELDVDTTALIMIGDATTDLIGAQEASSQFVGFIAEANPFPAGTAVAGSHAELRVWFEAQLSDR